MIITLTGFMGVGKSTVSEMLSRLLLCNHIDLDKYIENKELMSINDIFEKKGESYFREIESKYLFDILETLQEKMVILSLGGGALLSAVNQEAVKNKSICVYLRAKHSTLAERLKKGKKHRPVIKEISDNEEEVKLKELFQAREEGYIKSASFIVDVDDKGLRQIVDEIIALL